MNSPLKGSATVQLSEATRVRKQAEVQPSAIIVGAEITVFGKQAGEILTAHSIQAGAGGILAGGATTLAGSVATPPDATTIAIAPQGADQLAENAGGSVSSGTVAQIGGRTLTLERDDDTQVKVQIMDTTTVFQQETVRHDELQAGMFVPVTGQQQANSMAAETVEILPPPTQQ